MKYATLTVTPEVRQSFLDLYPVLENKPELWRMLAYLLFPSKTEENTGKIVISYHTLAKIAGQVQQAQSNNFKSEVFLKSFQKGFPDFAYNKHSHRTYVTTKFDEFDLDDGLDSADVTYRHKNKARTVERSGLCPEAYALGERIVADYKKNVKGRVYFDTGVKATPALQQRHQVALQEQLRSLNHSGSKLIIDYQNNLPSNGFRLQINKHYREALEYLEELKREEVGTDKDAEARRRSNQQAPNHLLTIIEESKPFIQAVNRSDRAFSYQSSLMTVRKDVRRILTKGWYEYDLRHAQLAIVAKLWNITELHTFLGSGQSFWKTLADEFKLPVEDLKEIFKTPLYALVFGASWKTIEEIALEEGATEKQFKQFRRSHFVAQIYQARRRRVAELKAAGYLDTIFGKRLSVSNDPQAHSALAREAQAVEVALILPVYEFAADTKQDFTVMLYQFDGITVRYAHPNTKTSWEREIMARVETKASELDIHTALESSV